MSETSAEYVVSVLDGAIVTGPATYACAWEINFLVSEQPDGWPTLDVSRMAGFEGVHASRGGRCLPTIPPSVFWPWVAGLVGLTLIDRASRGVTLLDLDATERCNAETTEGLHVEASHLDGSRRVVTLSVDDFWTELERLARIRALGIGEG